MRYVFKHENRQNHSTLLDIIGLLFTWIQKYSKETENRDTVVYRRWEDRFVRIRKKWSSFSLGVYGPSQNPQVLTYRARKNETNDSQHRPNKVFYYYNNSTNFSTVHWQMWAFKTMLRSSKFLLACQSNTLLENTGRNIRDAFIRVKIV